jgi:hypothetical protein
MISPTPAYGPEADLSQPRKSLRTYRKSADRLIVKDVAARLVEYEREFSGADWRMAYSRHLSHTRTSLSITSPADRGIRPLLTAGNVDTSLTEPPFHFVRNLLPEK